MRIRLLVLGFLIAAGCKEKTDETPQTDLPVYVNRFFAEATSRNVTLDRSSLIVKFVPATEIAPYSGYGTVNPPLVRIARERWATLGDVQKEILMFHELGHAVLRREHTNEMLPNCDYKSMMMDGNQFILYGGGSPKRNYYVDELFNPSTPYPDWSGPVKTNGTEIVNDPITDSTEWTFHPVSGSIHTGSIDSVVSADTPNSLSISGPVAGHGLAFWYFPVPSRSFPVGSTVVLMLKIKTVNVTGKGVWVNLQADVDRNKYFNTSTLPYAHINGTSDFTEYTLTLNCYPNDSPELFIYLFLDGASTGMVYFDDVRIVNYN